LHTVVTGAAGFIGANLIRALNLRGERDIIAVDNLTRATSSATSSTATIADYLDKEEFLARLQTAISTTTSCHPAPGRVLGHDGVRRPLHDAQQLSLLGDLLEWCQDNDVPFLYASSASVYGGGSVFREERAHESPLNVYGYSKFLFDQYVRRVLHDRTAQIVGFPLLQRVRSARAAQGAHGSVGLSLRATVRPKERCACSRAPAATETASSGAILSRSRTW
jgi:ADP-L-glycero-D-manno-heptose 6-epimerase